MRATILLLPLAIFGLATSVADSNSGDAEAFAARLRVPPGFTVELVAAPPLVDHPVMANFDPRGRLFVAETAGRNLKSDELLKELPNLVRVLAPADERGRFHKSHVFADKMSFPMGALWHRGALFVASPPSLWKLEDIKGAGVADRRSELVTKFGFTGNAADIHGPFLGPDGWLYWCDGRHGHNIARPDGTTMQGKAARIFRCKSDGTGVEVVCGGGMDNPVEIAFTPEGEPFFTVNIIHTKPARNDAICFALDGAVYPWHDVYKEFPRTGELMPTIENLGWVAPSGLMRYESGAFGKDYEGNLFSCQFNRNRIQRHIVTRDGAGFKMKSEDFLTSEDKNFHPTDVLEDADGSLLVVDTGGWFRIGCPTSKIAQPDIKGGIYRVRKIDAAVVDDARGLKIRWDQSDPSDLFELLDDQRFMVRNRAIEELGSRAGAANYLKREVNKPYPHRQIRNSVWALARMDEPAARAVTRSLLHDKDLSVKLAAIHSVGMHRDAKAGADLIKLLARDEHPAVRRQAATALGRIADRTATSALLEGIPTTEERFLEHALLFALIQIGDADTLTAHLHDASTKVRRAALIALDQLPGSPLKREQVAPLLTTDDPALLKAALDVIAARPAWGAEITGLLRQWMLAPALEPATRLNLRDLLTGLGAEPAIQRLIQEGLESPSITAPTRAAILESVARSPLTKLPPAWMQPLGQALQDKDELVIRQAIEVLRVRNLSDHADALQRLASNTRRSPETRVAALSQLMPRLAKLESALFDFAVQELAPEQPPLQRRAVAQALAQGKLDDQQLLRLTGSLVTAGALEMPHLLAAFESSKSDVVGLALIKSLEKAPGLASLSPAALDRAMRGFSKTVQDRSTELTKKLSVDVAQQKSKLDELSTATMDGDVEQGRNVFFGPKATCAACHSVGGKGGAIGPDLTKIGAIRAGRDLLESLVFPSASFARGFEPFVVETNAGKTHTGIVVRESADAVILVNADRAEIRLPRGEIEDIAPGRVSIMPQGLDAQLSRQELRDLMAYLQSLR